MLFHLFNLLSFAMIRSSCTFSLFDVTLSKDSHILALCGHVRRILPKSLLHSDTSEFFWT
ncbi:hypothetical protein KP509_23G036800 [Ceratopteris richardii]|uniref:Uncharacterized protein n=1 Tax=Ceratopteris richardii TaxID=49495 RepID=A0A8T2S1S4_CERRI|nr:hypothetical protein KP509_23G036800 [Ceratopteris richardii]